MKVIITGGTGMIGRALARRLDEDGDEIVVLSRGTRRPGDLPSSTRLVQWDAESGEGWAHELHDADAVVNLAGENIGAGRWNQDRRQRILDSRVNAGQAIVDAAERAGRAPTRLIQASGVNYYGHRGDEYVSEREPQGEDFLSDVCVHWEQSTQPLDSMGTRRAITRNGVVFDRDEGALPQLMLPFRLYVGGRIASGNQGFSWIHIADHVEANRFLLHRDSICGPVNLTAPEPVSNRELTRALGKVMNRPTLFPVPGFAVRLAIGEFAEYLINGQFVVPERLLEEGFEFQFPSVEPALRNLLQS